MTTRAPAGRSVRGVVAGGWPRPAWPRSGRHARARRAGRRRRGGRRRRRVRREDRPGICQRLDHLAQRSSRLVVRFEAGPDTRGSIAWLAARAQAATTAGDNDLAQLYSDRAARRTKAVEVLKALGPDLAAFGQQHCG